ncbi:unnamed protein product [Bursaphelenchus okinawaensis]|uniref:Uncharacterized protein n=1 Tax=Bursaphelenchus okinawaensis TaxID=465554 RepID=A0A811LFU9_9BILA|nr:unnamed protein product [Bursaphelenchus okinawaensis]CAG9122155.1 unnamed protein product [Bursaphelenchus okinawaensis]
MRFIIFLFIALAFLAVINAFSLRKMFEEENLIEKVNVKVQKRSAESTESVEEGSGERIVREASGEEVEESRHKREADVEGSGIEVKDSVAKREAEVEGSGSEVVVRRRRDVSSESSEEVHGSGHGSGQEVVV